MIDVSDVDGGGPVTRFDGRASAADEPTGRGVRVAVIDTGVEVAHPALRGGRVEEWLVEDTGSGPTVVSAAAGDPVGHGTGVAAIVLRGAPGAALASVRLPARRGAASTDHLFAALDWAVAGGFDVINVSSGSTYLRLLPQFKRRVDAAFVAGSVLVSASNNLDPEIVEYPAWFPSVVSVAHAALPPWRVERVHGRLVEFRACGVDVLTAWAGGGWRTVTGSSFAAPHVTALVARLRERHPRWNAAEVKAALYAIAATGGPG